MHEAVYRSDQAGKITFVNPALVHLTGFSAEELLGADAHLLLHPRWADGAPLPVRSCPLCGTPDESGSVFDTHVRTLGTEQIPVQLSQRPVTDVEGEPLGRVVSLRDVREQRLLEEQLRKAQKMEAYGQLAGGIAHEFNNLLTPILGNLDVLRGRVDEPEVRGLLDECLDAARRAGSLVAQMTAFGRRSEVFMQPTNVGRLVEEAFAILRQSVDRSIEVRTHIDPDIESARGDASLIRQVLLNLGLNARDAIRDARRRDYDSEGLVEFRVGTAVLTPEQAKDRTRARAGRFVVVSVADDGIGMSDELQARVFEPFFTTKRLGEGTGLGLAVVHGILEQHGGWIDVASATGVGTTFSCYFPAAAEAAYDRPVDEPDEAPGGTGTVLLVDDQKLVRRVGRRVLEGAGYSVLEVEDGVQALDLYVSSGSTIDLVLLDLSMPGMSGDEVLRELLAIDPDVKVVLWSGYSESQAVDSLSEAGARGFLAKPFVAADLLRVCARVLGDPPGGNPPDSLATRSEAPDED